MRGIIAVIQLIEDAPLILKSSVKKFSSNFGCVFNKGLFREPYKKKLKSIVDVFNRFQRLFRSTIVL